MNRIVLTAFLAALASASTALGQDSAAQTFTVPLTRPGEPLTLEISILSAEITIRGEDRKDVEFVVSSSGQSRKIITPSGPKALDSGGYGLQIDERNNHVEVDADWRAGRVRIQALIPRRADLKLSTTNDGSIEVRDVSGDLELDNTNGPITASGIRGSVIAESVNENISVSFDAINGEKPMAFSSVNGDLDISFPDGVGIELRIDSAAGEIYSDFEVEVVPTAPKVERRERRGGIEVRVDSEVVARINGGGTVVRLETLNGNIQVRKTAK